MTGHADCVGDAVVLPDDFRSYVSSVENLAVETLRLAKPGFGNPWLSELLDGQASVKLRETVPLNSRKDLGAFFSGSTLRAAAIRRTPKQPWLGSMVFDPAMGAGDLLIEVARQMPLAESLEATLNSWGSTLHGRDVEPEFVRLAKARLILLAVSRGVVANSNVGIGLTDCFPGLLVGNGLDALSGERPWGHIVMNPPFAYHPAPPESLWSRGRTNLAATFLGKSVLCSRPGTRLTAILPDVIRTGTRYERLRQLVANRLNSPAIEVFGQFDAWTDVDVFILRGIVSNGSLRQPPMLWWTPTTGEKIGDRFDISVGPVVPHRDPETNAAHYYLHARTIPVGGDFNVSHAPIRRFQGRVFRPPFIVVRRTSRPGDRTRGVGTLIHGFGEATVENHLLVLQPKDGAIRTCREVVALLGSDQAKTWLDERIRCRHLTVGAISDMPWFGS